MNDEIILACKDLTKRFGSVCALDHMDLQLKTGRIVGLLGPNGSGKTTLIKLINGLLCPNEGHIWINGMEPGIFTKSIVSYLPDKMYFADWMKVKDLLEFFEDFYPDFDKNRSMEMIRALSIDPGLKMKSLSKGTKEKVQLVLVMSRKAKLYLLDEPIAGVDPAARDFILHTVLTNYDPGSTVLISTHLISDVERILDEVVFIKQGKNILHDSVDRIRETTNKSVDVLFREMFSMIPKVQDGFVRPGDLRSAPEQEGSRPHLENETQNTYREEENQ